MIYFFDDDVTARIEDQIAQVRTSAGDVGGLVTTRFDTSVLVTVAPGPGTARNGRDGDCPVGVRAVDCRVAGWCPDAVVTSQAMPHSFQTGLWSLASSATPSRARGSVLYLLVDKTYRR